MTDDIFTVEQNASPEAREILRGMTEEVIRLERSAKAAEDRAKKLKALKKQKAETIVKMLTDMGCTSTKWDDGLMVIRKKEVYLSCPGENRDEFNEWLRANGYWELAKINGRTERSLLKERIENEKPVPDYLRKFEENGVTIRGKNAVPREEDEGGSKEV